MDIIENNHLSQFYQHSIIYFVNDLFTDKPSKLFSFQNHYFNDIHIHVSYEHLQNKLLFFILIKLTDMYTCIIVGEINIM